MKQHDCLAPYHNQVSLKFEKSKEELMTLPPMEMCRTVTVELLPQAQFGSQCTVFVDILLSEIVQQTLSSTNQGQQSPSA